MQSASDDELRSIGRVHTHKETVEAVRAARAAGFDNVSLDLIYGLPGQTMARWKENLQAAIALQPEHLSCYGLKVEEGTPLYTRRETMDLPDDDVQAEEYLATVELLESAGYAQYEISNFAARAASRATTSNTGRCRSIWASAPARIRTSADGALPVHAILNAYIAGKRETERKAYCPPEREREEERVMLALRNGGDLTFPRSKEDTADAEAVLAECAHHGLSRKENGRWRLTPQGFLVSNAVIVRTLEALAL